MGTKKSGSGPRVPMNNTESDLAAIRAFGEIAAADPDSRVEAAKLRWNQPDAEYLTAAMNSPGGWMYGPAMFQFFASGVLLLEKLGVRMLGTNTVERVRACLIEGTKHVYIVPTAADDQKGIKVTRYSDQTWINLVKLLAPAGIRVKSGCRERYDLSLEEASPVGPALFLNLAQMQERRRVRKSSTKKSQKSAPKGQQEAPKEQ